MQFFLKGYSTFLGNRLILQLPFTSFTVFKSIQLIFRYLVEYQ